MIRRRIISLLIWLTAISLFSAHAESIRTNDYSWGACMIICEDVSFCSEADYNDKSGTCSLFLNSADSGYSRLRKRCPQSSPDQWIPMYANDRWNIVCPSK